MRKEKHKNPPKISFKADQYYCPVHCWQTYPGSVEVVAACENDPQSQDTGVKEEEHEKLVVGVANTVVHTGSQEVEVMGRSKGEEGEGKER